MNLKAIACVFGIFASCSAPQYTWAYDIDCAILLCMAGGFPSNPVCARAYSTMIRRILPWPSLPPFGVCTYVNASVAAGVGAADTALNTSSPEFDWLNKTHVIWFTGGTHETRSEVVWDWSIRSCDRENRSCHTLHSVYGARGPWPSSFVSQSGQRITLPSAGRADPVSIRSILVEYGDYNGTLGHSEWFNY